MKYIKLAAVLAFMVNFSFSGCGKKTDTTDTQKKDNTMQQTQTQTQNTQTTQKMDTNKTKTDTTVTKDDSPNTVIMETSMGNMTIELYPDDAPKHVANFKKLVKSKFYDGLLFHRVIPGFMIQGGDPNTKSDDKSTYGQGGPGYTIPAEIKRKHEKGSLAAARLGDQVNPNKESSGSQFYIVTGEASHLDGQYTVYGKVIKGFDVAEKIQNVKKDERDNPIDKVVIKKVYFSK
jgi:cyclophilin family peptidyl-prolyl cis-trans isomerase